MGRGRSPSPGPARRERRRSRSRDRDTRVDSRRAPRTNDRHRRSRSRSPVRRRSRSRSPRRRSPPRRRSRSRSRDRGDRYSSSVPEHEVFTIEDDPPPLVDEADLEGMEPEEADMMRTMGFSGFNSTKGKPVKGNSSGATSLANITLKRKFRQYMNRRGGFNRPLDFIA